MTSSKYSSWAFLAETPRTSEVRLYMNCSTRVVIDTRKYWDKLDLDVAIRITIVSNAGGTAVQVNRNLLLPSYIVDTLIELKVDSSTD